MDTELKQIIIEENKSYSKLLTSDDNSKKEKFIKDYAQKISFLVLSNAETLTKSDLEFMDLIPNSVYSELPEKINVLKRTILEYYR